MSLYSEKNKWLNQKEFQKANCVKCVIAYGGMYIKNNNFVTREMDECRKKMLLDCDPPEFEDCITLDKKCYEVARELERQKKLTPAKLKLLAQKKREHIMVRMFGHQWWKKK
jgi:hypothetical protein